MAQSKRDIRNKYLLRKYGIKIEQYEEMCKQTSPIGACWICIRPPKPGKNLNVDHEHLTKAQKKAGVKFGRVRGLLCFFCNKYMIGRRKKQHAFLFRNAAQYLDSDIDWRIDAVQTPRR